MANPSSYPTLKETPRFELSGLSERPNRGALVRAMNDLARREPPPRMRPVDPFEGFRRDIDALKKSLDKLGGGKTGKLIRNTAAVAMKKMGGPLGEFAIDTAGQVIQQYSGPKSWLSGGRTQVKAGDVTVDGFSKGPNTCQFQVDWAGMAATTACLTLQAGGGPWPTFVVPASWPGVHTARWNGIRWATGNTWHRKADFTAATKIRLRYRVYAMQGAPLVPLSFDPAQMPVISRAKDRLEVSPIAWQPRNGTQAFVDTRAAIPYKMIPHLSDITPYRERGHDVLSPRGKLRPYQVPAQVTEINAGGNIPPSVRHRVGTHDHLPPGPRVREDKQRLGGAFARAVRSAVGHITEATDVIWATYWALPQEVHRECKRENDGFVGPLEAVGCILDNMDKIDGKKVLINLVANEIQDRLIGAGSKVARKGAENFGSFGTGQKGLGFIRQQISDFAS